MNEDILIPFTTIGIILVVLFYLYRALKTAATLKKIKNLPQACHDFWNPVVGYFPYESSLEKNLFTISGHSKILKNYLELISKGRALSHATYIWNRNLGLKETQEKALQTNFDSEMGSIQLGKGTALAFNDAMSLWLKNIKDKAWEQFNSQIDKFDVDPNQVYDGIQYWSEIDEELGKKMKNMYDNFFVNKKLNTIQLKSICCANHKIRPVVKTNFLFDTKNIFAEWLICPECKSHKQLIEAKEIVGTVNQTPFSGLKDGKMMVYVWNAESKSVIFHPIESLQINLDGQADWVASSYIDVYSNRLGDEIAHISLHFSSGTVLSENTKRLLADFKINYEIK